MSKQGIIKIWNLIAHWNHHLALDRSTPTFRLIWSNIGNENVTKIHIDKFIEWIKEKAKIMWKTVRHREAVTPHSEHSMTTKGPYPERETVTSCFNSQCFCQTSFPWQQTHYMIPNNHNYSACRFLAKGKKWVDVYYTNRHKGHE